MRFKATRKLPILTFSIVGSTCLKFYSTQQAGFHHVHRPSMAVRPHCVFDVVVPLYNSSRKTRIPGEYCIPEHITGGAAVGDYDGDGMEDIYFTVFHGNSVLYKNNGEHWNLPYRKRWRLVHLAIILSVRKPQKNAHKNGQESSRNFQAACIMLLVHRRISQKILISMCLLAVLRSLGIVVKCTAPIFYRAVDNNI